MAARPGGLDSFDVVLMDLHMPVMGGMEAVAQLQQRYPNRWGGPEREGRGTGWRGRHTRQGQRCGEARTGLTNDQIQPHPLRASDPCSVAAPPAGTAVWWL